MRLKPLTFGLALGITWGVVFFFTTWLSAFTGYAAEFLRVLGVSIYPGYSISPLGSFIGLGYAFVDGFVMGTIIAWVYNKLAAPNGK
jgi:hypothetical protein